jgi:hypothetical protein
MIRKLDKAASERGFECNGLVSSTIISGMTSEEARQIVVDGINYAPICRVMALIE